MCISDSVIIWIKFVLDIFGTKHQMQLQTLTTRFSILLNNSNCFLSKSVFLSLVTCNNVYVYVQIVI